MTKLAVFFLDAIRFQDMTFQNTPFLARISREGISGPLATLLAYEGLAATLFTGTYPSTHGVWTRYYADPEKSPFKWVGPIARWIDDLDGGLSFPAKVLRYGIMRLSNAMAGISYFPGLDEVPIRQLARMRLSLRGNLYEPGSFGNTKSFFDILRERGLSFDYFDHGVFDSDLDVFKRAVRTEREKDVNVVRLLDLDTASHRFGLGTKSALQVLKRTDNFVERIVSRWRERDPELAVLCFADHGMIPVKGSVDVARALMDAGLRPFEDFGMFLDSTMARFWGKEAILANVRKALEGLGYGKILSDKEREQFMIPYSDSWGQLIFLLQPGLVIRPSFFDTETQPKAMHGYDPATPGLETIAVLHWSKRLDGRSLSGAEMVDILPTMLDVLGIERPSYCQGTSLLMI